MSDTTTPEERAAIRSPSERWDALWYPHDRCHKMMLRLLTALEAAEAERGMLQQLVNELLSEELTDGAVRERIQLRFNMHEVLQENERLRAERDWLAGKLAELHDTSLMLVDGAPDGSNRKPYWKEAARRAVAAGEGE